MRQRHALVTSRGGLGFGVSHQFRVPAGGGVPVSAVPLGVLGARSSAIFQGLSSKSSTTVGAARLPAKWRQLRRLPELSPICAGADTFRRWN